MFLKSASWVQRIAENVSAVAIPPPPQRGAGVGRDDPPRRRLALQVGGDGPSGCRAATCGCTPLDMLRSYSGNRARGVMSLQAWLPLLGSSSHFVAPIAIHARVEGFLASP
jgi:hypothetical protein